MRFRVTICYDVEALEAPEALHLCTALAIPGLCFVGAEVHPALLQETPKSETSPAPVSETETKEVEP